MRFPFANVPVITLVFVVFFARFADAQCPNGTCPAPVAAYKSLPVPGKSTPVASGQYASGQYGSTVYGSTSTYTVAVGSPRRAGLLKRIFHPNR